MLDVSNRIIQQQHLASLCLQNFSEVDCRTDEAQGKTTMTADEDFKSSKARDRGAETCCKLSACTIPTGANPPQEGGSKDATRVCNDDSKTAWPRESQKGKLFIEITRSQMVFHWQDVELRYAHCRYAVVSL